MLDEKGYAAFPGGNNPFTCDMTIDGKPCDNHAALLYRTRHATKIVCDSCAQQLRTVKGMLAAPPIVEICLLELLPARTVLLAQLDEARRANACWSELLELDGLQRRRLEQVMGGIAVFGSMFVGATWSATPHWLFYIVLVLYALAIATAPSAVYWTWVAKKNDDIMKRYQ